MSEKADIVGIFTPFFLPYQHICLNVGGLCEALHDDYSDGEVQRSEGGCTLRGIS